MPNRRPLACERASLSITWYHSNVCFTIRISSNRKLMVNNTMFYRKRHDDPILFLSCSNLEISVFLIEMQARVVERWDISLSEVWHQHERRIIANREREVVQPILSIIRHGMHFCHINTEGFRRKNDALLRPTKNGKHHTDDEGNCSSFHIIIN